LSSQGWKHTIFQTGALSIQFLQLLFGALAFAEMTSLSKDQSIGDQLAHADRFEEDVIAASASGNVPRTRMLLKEGQSTGDPAPLQGGSDAPINAKWDVRRIGCCN